MSSTHLIMAAAALTVLAAPRIAAGQGAPDPAAAPAAPEALPAIEPLPPTVSLEGHHATFDRMKGWTLARRKEVFRKAAEDAGSEARLSNVAVRASALEQETSLTAVDRAAAVIKTSVDGAEAGLSIAPLALWREKAGPNQVNLTFAALGDAKTRFGLAYTYESRAAPQDLELAACRFEDVEAPLTKATSDLEAPLKDVCEQVVAPIVQQPIGGQLDDVMREAASACGVRLPGTASRQGGAEEDPKFVLWRAIDIINRLIREEQGRLAQHGASQAARHRSEDLERRLAALGERRKVLGAYREPMPGECHTEPAIEEAAKIAVLLSPKHRFGVGGTVDLFPITFGFQNEPETALSRGELQRWQSRVEYSGQWAGSSLSVNVGVGQQREALDDPLSATLSPSFSVARVLRSLTRDPLHYDRKRLRLVNGELPPRLSLGVDLSVDIALDRAKTQVTALQRFNGTLFLDFFFTKELAFRLGIPVSAEVKTREADAEAVPPVTEKRDLQWTIPLAVTTVLKL